MTTKLKTMLKKQVSWFADDLGSKKSTDSLVTMNKENKDAVTLRKNIRRRHRTSLGLEELLKCPTCKQQLKSPKMLPCQHTFCEKCLEEKFEEVSATGNEEKTLRCPVCRSPAREPSSLPGNLSLENLLRVVENDLVEYRSSTSKRPTSLYTAVGLVRKEKKKRSMSFRQVVDAAMKSCEQCKTISENNEKCGHCNQVFCKICQPVHAKQLKESFKPIIDQLQVTINKLDHRIESFKVKIDKQKDSIAKEIDAKIADLMLEKTKRLEMADEHRDKAETSAEDIKREIRESQAELAKLSDGGFDEIEDDKKIATFTKFHKESSDLISKALSLQLKTPGYNENKIAELPSPSTPSVKNVPKTTNRPKLVNSKDLQRPSGLAFDPRKGEVYVTCPGNGQIVVFDRHYNIVRRIQDPQMLAPQGIVFIESLQEIYVTDKWKHCIFVFNRKGQRVRTILEKGKLRSPEGLAVLKSRGSLYIADTGNDRILIIDFDGTRIGGIGPNEGAEPHNFNQPTDVAVSDSAVVVADCGNHKVKVFNHNGQLVLSIGGFGTFEGLLKSPEVVKLAADGNIVVGDSDNGRVQVFSPQGEFVCIHGSQGKAPGQLGWVSGLVCLPNGDILVADSKNNNLQLF